MAKLLVIDDEPSILSFFEVLLSQEGYTFEVCLNSKEAIEKIKHTPFDVVLTDLTMPGASGLEVLEATQKHSPKTLTLIMTAFATAESAIEAMKLGAYDYLMKPFKVDDVRRTIQNALEKIKLKEENLALREKVSEKKGLARMLGKSEKMKNVFSVLERIQTARSNVLITGESGTGKELCARAIHELSSRKDGVFLSVNCGAIVENLFESELFGYEKGAFTGADQTKKGLFELASGGTLFLDEVGDLPLSMQVKLLKALQDKEIRRVGGAHTLPTDVRIIAATNKDLEKDVGSGTFREDLFYRLNVIRLEMPPLRERKEDLPVLVDFFMRQSALESQKNIKGVAPAVMEILTHYAYPGNIRELQNIVEQCVALELSDVIQVETLPKKLLGETAQVLIPPMQSFGLDLEKMVDSLEKELLMQALKNAGGVRKKAAKLLNISFRSIRYRLEKHNIEVDPTLDES